MDEAGRGPLAGPVVAAAVVLAPETFVEGAADSKQLSAAVREHVGADTRDDDQTVVAILRKTKPVKGRGKA